MSYTRLSLSTGETVQLLTTESRWFVLSGFVFYTVLIQFLTVGIGSVSVLLYTVWIWDCVQRWFTEYAITNKRVLVRRGIVRRSVEEVSIRSLDGAELSQSVMGRVLGYGTVTVRGRSNTDLIFNRVGAAVRFRKIIQQQVDNAG